MANNIPEDPRAVTVRRCKNWRGAIALPNGVRSWREFFAMDAEDGATTADDADEQPARDE